MRSSQAAASSEQLAHQNWCAQAFAWRWSNLAWWVAVALQKSDGTPAAIWGLGGRAGGRPIPGEEIISTFTDATHHDLKQPAERAVLRGRLALPWRESS